MLNTKGRSVTTGDMTRSFSVSYFFSVSIRWSGEAHLMTALLVFAISMLTVQEIDIESKKISSFSDEKLNLKMASCGKPESTSQPKE